MRGRKLTLSVTLTDRKAAVIKKESPNEGTETSPYETIMLKTTGLIKKESPNEGTETRRNAGVW